MEYYEVTIAGANLISALKKPTPVAQNTLEPIFIQVKKGHTYEELQDALLDVQQAIFCFDKLPKKPKGSNKVFKFPDQISEIKAVLLDGHEKYRSTVAYTIKGIVTLDGSLMFQAGFIYAHMSSNDCLNNIADWISERRGYQENRVRYELDNKDNASELVIYYDDKLTATLNAHPVSPLDVTFAAMQECFFGAMTHGYSTRCL